MTIPHVLQLCIFIFEQGVRQRPKAMHLKRSPWSLHTFSVLLMIGKYQGHVDDHWPYHIVTLIWFIYYSFGTVVTGPVLSPTPPSRPTRPGRGCGATWRARAAASIWTRRWSSATTLSGWWVGAVYLVQCGLHHHFYAALLSAKHTFIP